MKDRTLNINNHQEHTMITNSVISLLDNIENSPPKKYSERRFLEINKVLEKRAQKIRVVTYNVLFDLFDDKLEEKIHSWPNRLPGIVAAIENMRPDILCVQEAYPKQLQDLQNQLENTFTCFVDAKITGELNAIFYKKERFELDAKSYGNGLSSGSIELPLNPQDDALIAKIPDYLPLELEPGRYLTLAHFIDKLNNKPFVVINAHLTYDRVNSKEDQAYFIVELVRKLHGLNKPVIFAGDLNTFPNRPDLPRFRFYDGDHIRQIFQAVLKNSKDIALLGHVGPLSTYTKDFLKPDSKPFEGIGTQDVVLDHIYLSPEVFAIVNATEPCQVNGQFPSDHMPVIADIIFI